MTIRKIPALDNATALSKLQSELAPAVLERWNGALRATAAAGDNVIPILGPIGESFFGEGITDKSIRAQLQRIGDGNPVEVHINSPGGVISHGTAIYNMFRQHKGRVTVKIIGMAASMASIIAMAGDETLIAKAGFMFLHQPESVAIGNKHVMEDAFNALSEFGEVMASIYAARSGLSDKDVDALMVGKNLNGTLMGSATVIEKGLADALLPDAEVKEDKATAQTPENAAVMLQAILSRAGVSRSERRTLMKQLSGTLRAAEGVTQDGARGEVNAAMAVLDSIKVR